MCVTTDSDEEKSDAPKEELKEEPSTPIASPEASREPDSATPVPSMEHQELDLHAVSDSTPPVPSMEHQELDPHAVSDSTPPVPSMEHQGQEGIECVGGIATKEGGARNEASSPTHSLESTPKVSVGSL